MDSAPAGTLGELAGAAVTGTNSAGLGSAGNSLEPTTSARKARNALSALRLFALLLALALASKFFVIVPAGERGVLLRFGAVQEQVLQEGLHPLLPVVYSVQPLSVRVQSLDLPTEASTRDLQDLSTDVTVNWHIPPERVSTVFQRVGDESVLTDSVIRPGIEDVIKAVVASFTAEQIVTERDQLKTALAQRLTERLATYDLVLDDVSLLQLNFSERFRDAVEAKQVAEQEAKRADFEAIKAQRLARARVYKAQGEAEAHQLLQAGLTPEVLQVKTIEKWNGHLPLVVGNEAALKSLDLKSLLKADSNRRR